MNKEQNKIYNKVHLRPFDLKFDRLISARKPTGIKEKWKQILETVIIIILYLELSTTWPRIPKFE